MIIQKAKELGLMLAESDEFIKMQTAEQAQLCSDEAQALLERYSTAVVLLRQKALDKDISNEAAEQIEDEMQKERQKLMENKIIAEYINACEAFSRLMREVNTAIAFYVQPEGGGCSGGCGSCGGCG